MKEYGVGDLFFNRWEQLQSRMRAHAEVYALYVSLQRLPAGSIEYGATLIAILRRLRKAPLLVDKINEEQAVDIFNELEAELLKKPWYFFPRIDHLHTPDAQLARTTFDQFIYADNEFTTVLVLQSQGKTGDELLRGMARLVATLYTQNFDKERVQEDAEALGIKNVALLQLVFFTFAHVREAVVKRCKHLLPPAPAPAADEPAEKPVASGPMWYKIKHAAARTLVFGDFDKLGRSNMYSVLDHLNLLQADAKP